MKRGWNQLYLSEKLGISTNFLSQVETGKTWVSSFTLSKLADALEVEVFELFKPASVTGMTSASSSNTHLRFAAPYTRRTRLSRLITS